MDRGEQHLDVLLPPQNPADRRRDVAGRERRGRDLIEERLKEMVIVAIEQRDAYVGTRQRASGVQAAKPAAYDNDGRDSGFGIRDSRFGVRASGFGLRDSRFGVRASGFGAWDSGRGILHRE